MEIRWRRNPKTPDGWPKRIAISLLAALVVFVVSLPVSFMISLNHLRHVDPDDTQILLAALTSAVGVGLLLFALFFFALLAVLYLFSLRGRPATQ